MEVRSELLVEERPGSWFIHLRLSAQLTCVKVFVVCARGFVVASVARLLTSAVRLGGSAQRRGGSARLGGAAAWRRSAAWRRGAWRGLAAQRGARLGAAAQRRGAVVARRFGGAAARRLGSAAVQRRGSVRLGGAVRHGTSARASAARRGAAARCAVARRRGSSARRLGGSVFGVVCFVVRARCLEPARSQKASRAQGRQPTATNSQQGDRSRERAMSKGRCSSVRALPGPPPPSHAKRWGRIDHGFTVDAPWMHHGCTMDAPRKRGCTMDAPRKCGCTMDTRGYTWIHVDARGYTVDEPRGCWINRDEGHTRSRAPERRANNEAGARGVGGARHGVRAHARAPARALLPWAAAERQQQAARPCLTRQHGRGVPSLARNGRRKEQRSSARAE